MHPMYIIRAFGGLLFVIGALIMVYNLWRTARGDVRESESIVTPAPQLATVPAE